MKSEIYPTGPTSYSEIIDGMGSQIYDLETENARLTALVERYRAALGWIDSECEYGDCSCRQFHAFARTALKEQK